MFIAIVSVEGNRIAKYAAFDADREDKIVTQEYQPPELDEAGGWLHSVAGGRQDSSPVVWLDAGDPPTLAAHGVRDPIVPVEQVRAFAAASVRTGHDRGLTVLEASSPAFGEACVGHMPWCGVPVAEVNRFLADL